MKAFFLLLLLGSAIPILAQTNNNNKLPPFQIVLPDGTLFATQNIKKGKPVILIYFSPDCDHCQALITSFLKKAPSFSKAEVVLVTFKPLEELKGFVAKYGIQKYPFITAGSEKKAFFIRYFYNVVNLPFTALYNKKGELVYACPKTTSVDDLAYRLGQLL